MHSVFDHRPSYSRQCLRRLDLARCAHAREQSERNLVYRVAPLAVENEPVVRFLIPFGSCRSRSILLVRYVKGDWLPNPKLLGWFKTSRPPAFHRTFESPAELEHPSAKHADPGHNHAVSSDMHVNGTLRLGMGQCESIPCEGVCSIGEHDWRTWI